MNFEKWWKDYDNIQCDKDACEDAFYAGQQSKQAEVDKLKMSNHHTAIQLIDAGVYYDYEKNRADMLQKQVDDLILSIDWHIEDCEFWLSMNKNDSWKGGQLEVLKAIKKRLKGETE